MPGGGGSTMATDVLRGRRESIGERFVRDRALKRPTVRRVRQAGHAGQSRALDGETGIIARNPR